ncbi:MAG: LytTR family transcriptional regulator [Chitinophagaceae bacterium]|nr:LytTR family transcriptional regulator [Chitinophagaceae bacterium]
MWVQPFLFIRVGRKYVRIGMLEIVAIESLANYIKVFTDVGTYLTPMTMKQCIRQLPENLFCRINRGTIVPIHRIVSFDKDGITMEGKKYSFGEGCKKELEARINLFVQEQKRFITSMRLGPLGFQPNDESFG